MAAKSFKVPKIKKPERKDNLRPLELTSRDCQEIVNIVKMSYLESKYESVWELKSAALVHNRELEDQYRAKKSEMKDSSRRDISDHYAFLMFADNNMVANIVKSGLFCRSLPHNNLGISKMGVYVCRNADVQLQLADNWTANMCTLVVFKIILGKCKMMSGVSGDENTEPAPNFDCHTPQISAKPGDPFNQQLARSQVYLYEYTEDCEASRRPRQCLPYAVLVYEKSKVVPKALPMQTDSYSKRPAAAITEKSKSENSSTDAELKLSELKVAQATFSRPDPRLAAPEVKLNPSDPRLLTKMQESVETGLCVPRLTAGPPPSIDLPPAVVNTLGGIINPADPRISNSSTCELSTSLSNTANMKYQPSFGPGSSPEVKYNQDQPNSFPPLQQSQVQDPRWIGKGPEYSRPHDSRPFRSHARSVPTFNDPRLRLHNHTRVSDPLSVGVDHRLDPRLNNSRIQRHQVNRFQYDPQKVYPTEQRLSNSKPQSRVKLSLNDYKKKVNVLKPDNNSAIDQSPWQSELYSLAETQDMQQAQVQNMQQAQTINMQQVQNMQQAQTQNMQQTQPGLTQFVPHSVSQFSKAHIQISENPFSNQCNDPCIDNVYTEVLYSSNNNSSPASNIKEPGQEDIVEEPDDMEKTLNELSDPDDEIHSPLHIEEPVVDDPALAEAMRKLVEHSSNVPLFTEALRGLQESAEEFGDQLTDPEFLVKKIAEKIEELTKAKALEIEKTIHYADDQMLDLEMNDVDLRVAPTHIPQATLDEFNIRPEEIEPSTGSVTQNITDVFETEDEEIKSPDCISSPDLNVDINSEVGNNVKCIPLENEYEQKDNIFENRPNVSFDNSPRRQNTLYEFHTIGQQSLIQHKSMDEKSYLKKVENMSNQCTNMYHDTDLASLPISPESSNIIQDNKDKLVVEPMDIDTDDEDSQEIFYEDGESLIKPPVIIKEKAKSKITINIKTRAICQEPAASVVKDEDLRTIGEIKLQNQGTHSNVLAFGSTDKTLTVIDEALEQNSIATINASNRSNVLDMFDPVDRDYRSQSRSISPSNINLKKNIDNGVVHSIQNSNEKTMDHKNSGTRIDKNGDDIMSDNMFADVNWNFSSVSEIGDIDLRSSQMHLPTEHSEDVDFRKSHSRSSSPPTVDKGTEKDETTQLQPNEAVSKQFGLGTFDEDKRMPLCNSQTGGVNDDNSVKPESLDAVDRNMDDRIGDKVTQTNLMEVCLQDSNSSGSGSLFDAYSIGKNKTNKCKEKNDGYVDSDLRHVGAFEMRDVDFRATALPRTQFSTAGNLTQTPTQSVSFTSNTPAAELMLVTKPSALNSTSAYICSLFPELGHLTVSASSLPQAPTAVSSYDSGSAHSMCTYGSYVTNKGPYVGDYQSHGYESNLASCTTSSDNVNVQSNLYEHEMQSIMQMVDFSNIKNILANIKGSDSARSQDVGTPAMDESVDADDKPAFCTGLSFLKSKTLVHEKDLNRPKYSGMVSYSQIKELPLRPSVPNNLQANNKSESDIYQQQEHVDYKFSAMHNSQQEVTEQMQDSVNEVDAVELSDSYSKFESLNSIPGLDLTLSKAALEPQIYQRNEPFMFSSEIYDKDRVKNVIVEKTFVGRENSMKDIENTSKLKEEIDTNLSENAVSTPKKKSRNVYHDPLTPPTPLPELSYQAAILQSIEESALNVCFDDYTVINMEESPIPDSAAVKLYTEPTFTKALFVSEKMYSDGKNSPVKNVTSDNSLVKKITIADLDNEKKVASTIDFETDSDEDERGLVIDLSPNSKTSKTEQMGSPNNSCSSSPVLTPLDNEPSVVDLIQDAAMSQVDNHKLDKDPEDVCNMEDNVPPLPNDVMKSIIEKRRKNMVIKLKEDMKQISPAIGKDLNASTVGSSIEVIGQTNKSQKVHPIHGVLSVNASSENNARSNTPVSKLNVSSPGPVARASPVSSVVGGITCVASPVTQMSAFGQMQQHSNILRFIHPATGQPVIYGNSQIIQPMNLVNQQFSMHLQHPGNSVKMLPHVGMIQGTRAMIPGQAQMPRNTVGFMIPGHSQMPGNTMACNMIPGNLHMTGGMMPGQLHMTGGMMPGHSQMTSGMMPGQPQMTGGMMSGHSQMTGSMMPEHSQMTGGMMPGHAQITEQVVMGGFIAEHSQMPVAAEAADSQQPQFQDVLVTDYVNNASSNMAWDNQSESPKRSDIYQWFSDKFQKRETYKYKPTIEHISNIKNVKIAKEIEANCKSKESSSEINIKAQVKSVDLKLKADKKEVKTENENVDRKRRVDDEVNSNSKKIKIETDAKQKLSSNFGSQVLETLSELQNTSEKTYNDKKLSPTITVKITDYRKKPASKVTKLVTKEDNPECSSSSELEDGEISDDSEQEDMIVSPVKYQTSRKVVIENHNSSGGSAAGCYSSSYNRMPPMGSANLESPKRVVKVHSEQPQQIPTVGTQWTRTAHVIGADWADMLQNPNIRQVERVKATTIESPSLRTSLNHNDNATNLLSKSAASISKSKQKIVAHTHVKTLGDWLKVELETDDIQPLQDIIPYSLDTDLTVIPKPKRRKLRTKVKNAIEQEGKKKMSAALQAEASRPLIQRPAINTNYSPEVTNDQIEKELYLLEYAFSNLKDKYGINYNKSESFNSLYVNADSQDKNLMVAMTTVSSEMKSWLQRACFYGYPHRRVPSELLLESEMSTFRSEVEDVFLILMMPISAKPYNKLLQMKESLTVLKLKLSCTSDPKHIEEIEMEIQSHHSQRQALLRSFTGYLNKKRIQKIQDTTAKYTLVYDYLRMQTPPVPDAEIRFIRTTLMDLRQHFILAKQYLAIEEKKSDSSS